MWHQKEQERSWSNPHGFMRLWMKMELNRMGMKAGWSIGSIGFHRSNSDLFNRGIFDKYSMSQVS